MGIMTSWQASAVGASEGVLVAVDRRLNPSLRPSTSRVRRVVDKIEAHWRWGRTQGWKRLIEEDQLNPVDRVSLAARKRAWRLRHGVAPGTGLAVFVVGLQRSGTNMLVHGLERAPAVEVHNENDRAVFEQFRLRPDPVVHRVLERSRHTHVLFKPLCDSHRVHELLALAPGRARAVWTYRDVDGRTRSSLAKFGSHNSDVLKAIVSGRADGMWQAGGLDDEALAVLRSFDVDAMDPASAAALFWWLRNRLFFTQGLDQDERVHLASYGALLREPEATMRALCSAVEMHYTPGLVAHVEAGRQGRTTPLDLDPGVRALCDELGERLERARSAQSVHGEPPA